MAESVFVGMRALPIALWAWLMACVCVYACVVGRKIKMCPKDGSGREKAKRRKKGACL